MSLQAVYIQEDLGLLRYFNSNMMVTEREKIGSEYVTRNIGYRYQLLSFSGLGQPVHVNTFHLKPVTLPLGATVKLVNPVVKSVFVRTGQSDGFQALEIWADDIVAVKN